MKIAEISTFAQYSVGRIMLNIKSYIDSFTNDECKIFYARGYKNLDGCVKISNNMKVKLNAFMTRFFDNDGRCIFPSNRKLINELKAYNPDVIHLHCLHGYYLNIGPFFDYLRENPQITVVWTQHDSWSITGHCAFFDKVSCEKWRTGCYSCPLKKEFPKSYFFDRSKKNYLIKKRVFTSLEKEKLDVIVPSNWLGNIIKESFLNKYTVTTIYNGIDLNVFNLDQSKHSINLTKKVILGVASVWDNRKGLSTFYQLEKVLPNDWIIVIIGKILGNKIKSNKIVYIERTDSQEVLKSYYQNAAVILNPTKDDNYPTINLEAQACGGKVVCFNTGGCAETNCGNLYLIEPSDNAEEIMNKIIEVVEKPLNNIDFNRMSKEEMARQYYEFFCKKREEKNVK